MSEVFVGKPRVQVSLRNGRMLVGSDGHYWPGEASTAHRAFVAFVKEYKPEVVVFNGDALDASTISRHPPIGWEKFPSLKEELEGVQERLGEVETAAKGRSRLIWSLGNHDARFNTRLAMLVPEYKKVKGFQLRDHFPAWQSCWAVHVNRDVVVKHRFKGGKYAPANNAVGAGRTMVTGHLHSQKVIPVTDYNGTRWGVDTGCLADPSGPQFSGYTEDNPLDWRQGFAMLTFIDGELLQPELIRVAREGVVDFRGELIDV